MINEWLRDFLNSWRNKDIDAVLSLFTDGVEYWETPFKEASGKKELKNEWQAVLSQENLIAKADVFMSDGDKHTVRWVIRYENENSQKAEWAGVYLMTLDNDGKCNYFYQVGESK